MQPFASLEGVVEEACKQLAPLPGTGGVRPDFAQDVAGCLHMLTLLLVQDDDETDDDETDDEPDDSDVPAPKRAKTDVVK